MPTDPRLLRFARSLRKDATEAERALWKLLRDRSLGGFKFRRQHPAAGYILDFYCVEKQLAVELDGGQHLEPEAARYDQLRSGKLSELDIRVLRFASDQMLREPTVVAEAILAALEEQPSP